MNTKNKHKKYAKKIEALPHQRLMQKLQSLRPKRLECQLLLIIVYHIIIKIQKNTSDKGNKTQVSASIDIIIPQSDQKENRLSKIIEISTTKTLGKSLCYCFFFLKKQHLLGISLYYAFFLKYACILS